jgi:sugar phosphate isomerase/epimerase
VGVDAEHGDCYKGIEAAGIEDKGEKDKHNMDLSRREWFGAAALGAGAAGLLAPGTTLAKPKADGIPFRYSLNTSTISGQRLTLVEEIEIAAKAGYDGIEPWVGELDKHKKSGGSLSQLGQRIKDRGLRVPNAIGFFEWIVDDEGRRKKGLEEARRAMDLVKQIGGAHLAAPPAGATNQRDLDLLRAAERYRALLELGEKMGVAPVVEFWGPSRCLSRLGEAALVAIESRHPRACILADIYHLYKGGSGFEGLKLLGGDILPVIHMNDYPAEPPRARITDAHRLYPGDGIAPWKVILPTLLGIRFKGMLSLELFNRDYWKQDALKVAQIGLAKMKALVV